MTARIADHATHYVERRRGVVVPCMFSRSETPQPTPSADDSHTNTRR